MQSIEEIIVDSTNQLLMQVVLVVANTNLKTLSWMRWTDLSWRTVTDESICLLYLG